jgi:ABC-type transport system involved in cytochrome bd biosynthesis fused ATPase/permease subunit
MVQTLRLVGARALLQRLGGIDARLGERGAMISCGENARASASAARCCAARGSCCSMKR